MRAVIHFFIVGSLYAQHIITGVEGGITYNTMQGDLVQAMPRVGAQIAAYIENLFNEWVGVKLSANVVMKSYFMKGKGSLAIREEDVTVRARQVSFLPAAKFLLMPLSEFLFLYGGVYLDIPFVTNLSVKEDTRYDETNTVLYTANNQLGLSLKSFSEEFRRSHAGFTFGLSFMIKPIEIQFEYYQGSSMEFRSPSGVVTARYFLVGIGYDYMTIGCFRRNCPLRHPGWRR